MNHPVACGARMLVLAILLIPAGPAAALVAGTLTAWTTGSASADDLPETPRPRPAPAQPPMPAPAESAAVEEPMPDVRTIQAPDGSELYLSWNAPYGRPRAATARPHTCGRDQRDTLYLSFRPGRSSPTFIAFMATLQFRPAAGDTLLPWWHFGGKGEHEDGLRCQYQLPASEPHLQPWRVNGLMWQEYTWAPDAGTLRMLFAVPDVSAGPVHADSVYVLARILLEHDPSLPGCEQPVCIEWKEATLSYSPRREPIITAGSRFVSWNSGSGRAICAPFEATRPRAWRPGGPR